MEFLTGSDGSIIPDPETTDEQLAKTESAMSLFRANADRINISNKEPRLRGELVAILS